MDFNSIGELEKYLLAQIKSAMDKEVADVVKKEESEQVKEYYDKFEPDRYKRRGDKGGLSDIRNMKHKIKTNGTQLNMTVTNTTRGNPKFHPFGESVDNLAGIVEEGNKSDYNYPYGKKAEFFLIARPFTSKTVYKLIKNNEIIKTLKLALASRGLIVE